MYKIKNKINMREAKTHFSEIVNAAAGRKKIVITKAGKPVARLVPLEAKKPKVRFGLLKGKISVAQDFDAPLPDEVMDLFEGT